VVYVPPFDDGAVEGWGTRAVAGVRRWAGEWFTSRPSTIVLSKDGAPGLLRVSGDGLVNGLRPTLLAMKLQEGWGTRAVVPAVYFDVSSVFLECESYFVKRADLARSRRVAVQWDSISMRPGSPVA